MNDKIRAAAKESGVRHWEIAERLEMDEGTFCRKLRRELPEEDQRRILKIIKELSKRE